MSAVVSNEHSLAEESRAGVCLAKPDDVEGSHGPDTAHRALTSALSRYRAQCVWRLLNGKRRKDARCLCQSRSGERTALQSSRTSAGQRKGLFVCEVLTGVAVFVPTRLPQILRCRVLRCACAALKGRSCCWCPEAATFCRGQMRVALEALPRHGLQARCLPISACRRAQQLSLQRRPTVRVHVQVSARQGNGVCVCVCVCVRASARIRRWRDGRGVSTRGHYECIGHQCMCGGFTCAAARFHCFTPADHHDVRLPHVFIHRGLQPNPRTFQGRYRLFWLAPSASIWLPVSTSCGRILSKRLQDGAVAGLRRM